MAICSLFLICNYADAATRTAVRTTPISRKSLTVKKTPQPIQQQNQQEQQKTVEEEQQPTQEEQKNEQEQKPETVVNEPENIEESGILNKSDQFDEILSEILENSTQDNSFAEQIRRQRAALERSESMANEKLSMKNSKTMCDSALRECMKKTCGDDFTKCALDGDTIFGDKLNKCRRDTECTGTEFKLFSTEIKADRDMNVKLSSYYSVINCGSAYNACLMNECDSNFDKCLGKTRADAAIKKCSVIARDCMEYDSGLTSRFNTVIARLRENAESEIKKDEEQLYKLRELIATQCTSMGAVFDERTFDCVYTVNFYTGEDRTLTASRKRYAGDTFICMQEWFGVNATTYKENAYRETRAQTGASSAMLGSGLGTAAGLASSGAIGRALDTQNAKKAYKEDCEANSGTWKNGKCDYSNTETDTNKNTEPQSKNQNNDRESDSLSRLNNMDTSQIMKTDNETEIPSIADINTRQELEKEQLKRIAATETPCFSNGKDVCEYLDVDYYTVSYGDLESATVLDEYALLKDYGCAVDAENGIETDDFTYVPCKNGNATVRVFQFPNNQDGKGPITDLFCLAHNAAVLNHSNNRTICDNITREACEDIETASGSLSVTYKDNKCAIGIGGISNITTPTTQLKTPAVITTRNQKQVNKEQKKELKTIKEAAKKQEKAKQTTSKPAQSYVEDREDIKLDNKGHKDYLTWGDGAD